MRLVCVPDELTPFYLLELREIPAPLADRLQGEVRRHYEAGQLEEALVSLDTLYTAAWAEQDRYATAIIVLYRAEVLRRMQRWEETLDQTQRALNWLRTQVTQVAHYNRAVALYFAGLIHFALRADGKTLRAFTNAQEILAESERYWGFESSRERVAACQDLTRWMSNLLELSARMTPGEWAMIVPVYEIANQATVRVGVTLITPFKIALPRETLVAYLPSHYVPLDIDELPFLQLHPDARYLAFRITTDGDFVAHSRAGDILLTEEVFSDPSTRAAMPSYKSSFVRRMDGHILFGPYERVNEDFVRVGRVLIRAKEEEL
ncbi:MAG TPA: hypothetical protein PKZ84_23635 [Anaerolineae bacterium]|nr:hypothetical protein [Anaerolineae bacterium]HQI87557.1 hypothetical protein [Anaerolineae bacterium]